MTRTVHDMPHVGIVGVGAVGKELFETLLRRKFPMMSITLFGRSARSVVIGKSTLPVNNANYLEHATLDLVFFAGTEGEKGASNTYRAMLAQRNVTMIDNGDDFRMEPGVPLVVPEINPDDLRNHGGFIANPNCSTIIALMALAPLHRRFTITSVVASTYQSVSGAGSQGIAELDEQLRLPRKVAHTHVVFPTHIAHNAIPSIGSLLTGDDEYSEEKKLRRESQKILGAPNIDVSAMCVRIPAFVGHAMSLWVETKDPVTKCDVLQVLQEARGVRIVDNPAMHMYPTILRAEETDDVLVGRIRINPQKKRNGIAMFVAGNNLTKGAALNAVQIAEELLRSSSLKKRQTT